MILLLALLIRPCEVAAQPRGEINFRSLKNSDGLSQNSVHAIVQDRYGFIWIGTEDGLNRYDGTRFQIYKHNPTDTTSISSSFVRTMLVDEAGRLWIGTDNGGLSRYNYATDDFTNYRQDPESDNTIAGNQVWDLAADPSGKLWVGTKEGLSAFDPNTKTFTNYYHEPSSYASLGTNWVRSLHVDDAGQLWVGAEPGGLHLFLSEKEQFLHFWAAPSDPDGMPSNRILDIAEDGRYLWIATYEGGLVKFDKERRRVVRVYDENDHPALRDVHGVLPTANRLWILTQDRGLLTLDLQEQTFVQYRHEGDNPRSLTGDIPLCIFQDESETIWIGTADSGLSKYNAVALKFTHIRPGRGNGIEGEVTIDFAQDTAGHIWVGTNIGLFRSRAPGTLDEGFRRWGKDNPTLRSLLANAQVITASDDGLLWVGTRDKLIRINSQAGSYRTTKISGGGRMLSVQAILPDSKGYLWVGTSGGLYRFQFEEGALDVFTTEDGLPGEDIKILYEDHNHSIWVGTETGLGRFNTAKNRFVSFRHDPDNVNSISNNRIFSLAEDREQRLWVGTANGLNRWSPTDDSFVAFFESRTGLANSFIKGLRCDADNNLWISTNNGISRFDVSNETFVNFSVVDGLQGLEFLPHSCLQTRQGDMLFGGTNGFNWFNPALITYNIHPPRAVITDIRVFGQSLESGTPDAPLSAGTMQVKSLELPSDQNAITFEFAALDFVLPEKNRVVFKLGGQDKDWRYDESGKNTVEYSSLAPGTYTFRLRASNNDGIWGSEQQLQLTITPPFWQTLTFQIIIGILLIGIFIGVYRYRVWQIERQQRLLEQQVQERTREIRQKNEQLEEQKEELEGQKREILTQNQELEKQAKEIQEQHDQIDQQHRALKSSNDKLQEAYRDIEQKNLSITDSIRYAKTIQEAVLPTKQRIEQHFTDSFILYLPKAIVSGDFFWSVQVKDMTFVAAIDCTGHGVPGAFMSLIGNTLLNEIVNQDRIYEPDKILERLHVRIRVSLKQAQKANEDGMDMILCRIQKRPDGTSVVRMAGAKRPLYVYHADEHELQDWRGDRRSIGGRQKEDKRTFTATDLVLPEKSILYLTTDGFSDQISPERKKYGSVQLKDLLFKLAPLSFAEQEHQLRHTLQKHRKEVPQIDDVTILALQL